MPGNGRARRLRKDAFFARIADELASDFDLVALLGTALEACITLLDGDGGDVLLRDADGRLAVVLSTSAGAPAEGTRTFIPVPMRLRGEVVGAIEVFGRARPRSVEAASVAQAVADLAALGLLHGRVPTDAAPPGAQEVLVTAALVERARGALALQHAVTVRAALDAMRRHGRSVALPLQDVARGVLDGTADVVVQR